MPTGIELGDTYMSLNWNGVVVTTIDPGDHIHDKDTNYRGIAYGRPWPLFYVVEPEDKTEVELDQQIDGWFIQREAPEVIPDVQLVNKYVELCQAKGLAVRTLLCATTSDWPLMDCSVVERLPGDANHLGYDYWDGGERSILLDGLVAPPSPVLKGFARRLNKVKLFDELSDLEAYVNARNEFIHQQGWESEDNPLALLIPGEFYPTDVWELQRL